MMVLALEHLLLDFAINSFETQVFLRTLEFVCSTIQDLLAFFLDSCYFSYQHLSTKLLVKFLTVNCYSELPNSH